ncbi:chemotaxis protein CheW [Starkeya sp. 3C]|uniref:Chemotaxis protein CheW n=2 Tax=Ancylobacter moscoviensis TaxID=2597768 RepID=A0ABY3DTQ3_9HYPH|nr:chemotaxis protein CheW [Ancylobacter moscoviensis]
MFPVDSLTAAPRGSVPNDAAFAAKPFRASGALRAEMLRSEPPRPAPARVDVLVFSFHGMRFALPAAHIVDVMTVSGARWERLVAMSATGTLGASGLPLIRLAARMGFAADATNRPVQGGLVLFGTAGKVRATVLIDDVPTRVSAGVETMPASWRSRFSPCEDMIDGVALLPDGAQAAMIDLPLGVNAPRAAVAGAPERDTAHLLVRAGRAQLEAVRIAAVRDLRPLDEVPGLAVLPSAALPRGRQRMLLEFGGQGDVVAVDEVVGLAPQGRIERVGSLRFLATPTGRYRLLEPGGTQPARAVTKRVLVTAPEDAGRSVLRDLVRSMGHEVSLADDPRAARLAGGRFDVILFDLDAYEDVRAGGVEATDGAQRIGLAAGALPAAPRGFARVVPAGDAVALALALLRRA